MSGRKEVGGAGVGEGPVAVVALFVDVVGAGQPVLVEGVLGATGDVNGVGRLVVGADEVAGDAGAALQAARTGERVGAGAAGEGAGAGGGVGVVDSLKRGGPSVLREVVVVETKPGAEDGLLAAPGRVGEAEARGKLLAVIVRHAGHGWNLERLQGDVGAVLELACGLSPRRGRRWSGSAGRSRG